MDNFKSVLLTLRYKDTSIYPDNWKYVIDNLVDASAAEGVPKNWIFGLSQLQSAIMHTVCPVCDDVPLFKWLRALYDSFVAGTEHPEMPSCGDCREEDLMDTL